MGRRADRRPLADLRRFAELFAVKRADASGGLDAVTADQWRQDWEELRGAYAVEFRPTRPALSDRALTQPTTEPAADLAHWSTALQSPRGPWQ